MNVIGFLGSSGSGKTTLVEQVVARLRAAGLRVSVVKHAHHDFEIDHEGKDSWRHRRAGAYEVVIASDVRLALIREYERPADLTVHDLIRELSPCDWVLVEGFKGTRLPKIEVWRPSTGQEARYPADADVIAICTDRPDALPLPTALPVLDVNDPQAVADFMRANERRCVYAPPAQGER